MAVVRHNGQTSSITQLPSAERFPLRPPRWAPARRHIETTPARTTKTAAGSAPVNRRLFVGRYGLSSSDLPITSTKYPLLDNQFPVCAPACALRANGRQRRCVVGRCPRRLQLAGELEDQTV